MATEDTPLETVINCRWDAKEGDRETYDFIFDIAVLMTISSDRGISAAGGLLLKIVNEWEKNPRFVTMPVISAAYDLALEWQEQERSPDDLGLDVLWQDVLDGYAS